METLETIRARGSRFHYLCTQVAHSKRTARIALK
jgi:hypothetical protein